MMQSLFLQNHNQKFEIQELINISNELGSNFWLVQGPGGNTSLKSLKTDCLVVKGSGLRLKEVQSSEDFPVIDIENFKSLYLKPEGDIPNSEEENDYISAIDRSAHPFNVVRPSMEAGFHCFIPSRWVIHLHSLSAIILGALHSENPRKVSDILAQFCKKQPECNFDFIEPAIPGLHLTELIAKKMNNSGIKKEGFFSLGAFFLKSHGVVWFGNDLEKITSVIDMFERFMGEFFRLNILSYEIDITSFEANLDWKSYPFSEPLFPDVCVFFPAGFDKIKIKHHSNFTSLSFKAYSEISKAKLLDLIENFISQCVLSHFFQKHQLTQVYPQAFAALVKQMQIEKLRLKQIKESH